MARSVRQVIERLLDLPYGVSPWVQHRVQALRRGFYRENYFYCIERSAREAVALGHRRMSVIELGVAGGNGLIELERICGYLEARLPIQLSIYGFDSGEGLPAPTDYRDAPYKWNAGDYVMDRAMLEKNLMRSTLVIGDVNFTVPSFVQCYRPPPIGAVMFDLDYYSSTVPALSILQVSHDYILPRVQCYFDDVGVIPSLGVPLAISEFNASQRTCRLEQNLRTVFSTGPYVRGWKIHEFHSFSHPDYEKSLSTNQQAPLKQ